MTREDTERLRRLQTLAELVRGQEAARMGKLHRQERNIRDELARFDREATAQPISPVHAATGGYDTWRVWRLQQVARLNGSLAGNLAEQDRQRTRSARALARTEALRRALAVQKLR